MNKLGNNTTDYLTSVAKGIVGVCPLIGPIASEAIGVLIPEQRLDRVAAFLKELDTQVHTLNNRFEVFEQNVQRSEGLEILEDGLVQSAHSASSERKQRLARLVSKSLTKDELDYEESKKILSLFRELTDPEVIWLLFYSLNPTLGRGPHTELVDQHPEILGPISREMGAPQEQLDKAALQDSYKNTLTRFGLIAQSGRTTQITALGKLLVRYVENE